MRQRVFIQDFSALCAMGRGKAALLDDRAHLGKARILVPSAALVEPRERDERKREDQDLKATGGHREMTNDGWRTEDK